MALAFDPITVMNLIFDLIILCLGVFAYLKAKGKTALAVGAGFAFFAISYVITILGFGSATYALIPLRVLGYLSVIVGLCMSLAKKGK